MSAANILDRLDRVRSAGAGRWVASCPAHQDRRPSLSIREMEDGRVLVHCFGGCDVESVLDAAGLTFDDLYPPREVEHGRPVRRPWSASQLIHLLDHEALVVLVTVSDKAARAPVSEGDMERLALARNRIAAIVQELPR